MKNKNKFNDNKCKYEVSAHSTKSKPNSSFENHGHFKHLNTSNNEEPLISNSSRQRIDSDFENTEQPTNNLNCINLNLVGDSQFKEGPLYSRQDQRDDEIELTGKDGNNRELRESKLMIEEKERNNELELNGSMNSIDERSIQKRDPFELKERSQSKSNLIDFI